VSRPNAVRIVSVALVIIIIRPHQVHEMQTIVTDVRDVCLFVRLSRGSTGLHCGHSWEPKIHCVRRGS